MDRRIVPALALLLGALAVPALAQDPPKPDGGPPAPLPPSAAPAAPPAPAETDAQVLERITGEMMKKVEEIRGLKFKKDVKRVWKSRDEAKAEMIADIDKDTPPEKLAAASREMAFFGFVKEGTDLKVMFADFISAGAGGYYKPDTKVFSLVRGFSEDASRPIVFHELIHAIEDQYFDYQARSKKFEDEDMGDHGAAIQALVEGSARVYEDRFVDGEEGLRSKYFAAQQAEGSGDSAAKVAELPPVIIISMVMYPYGNGSVFLKAVIPALEAKGEKDAIGAVYANPPSSTEQILHPEKYLASDLPRTVKLPDFAPVLGEGWKLVGQGEQGEFSTGLAVSAILLPYNMGAQAGSMVRAPDHPIKTKDDFARYAMTPVVKFRGDTAKAAEGWDGDRYALLENGGRMTLAWVSAWDTPEDAAEFAGIYGKVIARKYGTVKEEPAAEGEKAKKTRIPPASGELKAGEWTGTRWTGTRDGDTAIVVKGDRVVVVERAPAESLVKMVEAAAKAEIVQDPKDTLPAKGK